MGFPLNLQNSPDIGTPGFINDKGESDRQNNDARQNFVKEYTASQLPDKAINPASTGAGQPEAAAPARTEAKAIVEAPAAQKISLVAEAGEEDKPDPMLDPSKTWEQKYEAVESYIRDHYYPQDKLQASNFYQLDKKYLGTIKTEADYIKAIKDETETLKDPWTEFTSNAELSQMRQTSNDGGRSTGIWIKNQGKDVAIEALLWGFPAYKSNLKIGDKLTSINGKPLAGMSLEQIEPMLAGKEGQSIKIGYETPEGDKKVETLPIVSPHEMHSSAEIVTDPKSGSKVLHLGLLSFDKEADDQLEDAIKALPKNQLSTVSGIVLDLRGNEGGYLPPITRTADMFVKTGPLFRIDSRDGSDVVNSASFDESDYTLDAATRSMLRTAPLAILVNGTTRSAPETLTASLREQGRPCAVIGDKTYGKAIAYDMVKVPDGMLKLTIEELKTPSGVAWQGKGLQPDIAISNARGANAPDDQLAKAIETVVNSKK